jgi:phenylacetate-CoA ligase
LYYITKALSGRRKCKEFTVKQTTIDTFIIKYVSDIVLSQNQIKKIEEAITLYLEPNLKFSFIKKDTKKKRQDSWWLVFLM